MENDSRDGIPRQFDDMDGKAWGPEWYPRNGRPWLVEMDFAMPENPSVNRVTVICAADGVTLEFTGEDDEYVPYFLADLSGPPVQDVNRTRRFINAQRGVIIPEWMAEDCLKAIARVLKTGTIPKEFKKAV